MEQDMSKTQAKENHTAGAQEHSTGGANGKFSISSGYKGPKKFTVPTRMYSHHKILKAMHIKSTRQFEIDLGKLQISFHKEGKLKKIDDVVYFRDLLESAVDISRFDSKKYSLFLNTRTHRYKFKFANSDHLEMVVNAIRSVRTPDHRHLISVFEDYLVARDKAKQGKTSSSDKDITSDEDEDFFTDSPGEPIKNETYLVNDPDAVKRAQEQDEEYHYLKWKYIDRFEPGTPAFPTNLEKYREKDAAPHSGHEDELRILINKQKAYGASEKVPTEVPESSAGGQLSEEPGVYKGGSSDAHTVENLQKWEQRLLEKEAVLKAKEEELRKLAEQRSQTA